MGLLGDLIPVPTSNIRRGLHGAGFRPSPPFNFVLTGSITASSTAAHDVGENAGSFTCSDGTKATRFAPFSKALIKNNADEVIYLWPNGDQRKKVTVLNREVQSADDLDILSFVIENDSTSGTIAPREIIVMLWNE